MNCRIVAIALGVALTAIVARAEDKPAAADPVAAGKALVVKNKCSICHLVEGKGGKMGKPMAEYAGKTEEQLKEGLVDPKKAIAPDTKMPSYKEKMTEDELKAVVAYVKSLKP